MKTNYNVIKSQNGITIESNTDKIELKLNTKWGIDRILKTISKQFKDLYNTYSYEIEDYLLDNFANNFKRI